MEALGDSDDEYLPASESEGGADIEDARCAPPAELAENVRTASFRADLRDDAARRLALATLKLERFLRRPECRGRHMWGPTRDLGEKLIEQARHLLGGALSETGPLPGEPTLRSAYRMIGSLGNLAAWSAPASQESHALASYPSAAARDVVSYSRFGSVEIAAQESAYFAMLGIKPPARLLLTSSGMTAYALIEAYLLREVLAPQDRILLHPSVYFETRQQIASLPQFSVQTAAGGSREDMLAAIATVQPRVVFVDPLSNSADFRAIDMPRLLDEAEQVCQQETWFVVDGTLLSGGFDPFGALQRQRVHVLYYESGCKYLQFGMDLGPAGLVVVESALAERFEQLRRGIGAIGSDALVLPRASRESYLKYLSAQSACAKAVARAASEVSVASMSNIIAPVHPSQSSHPDHLEARQYPHLGGVLVFRFSNSQLNRRRPLEDFVDFLIEGARAAKLPLTAGVSFGFCIPRIGAAWSSYEADEAFLRLSAGVDVMLAASLGRLIVESANKFVAQGVH